MGGLCFFLSALEYMIPKPLPFIRIGLANLPLLLALDIFPFSYYMLLVALKVTGQALVSGTLFSYVFLFSISGAGVSALLTYALRRSLGKERISLIGISAAGALASNGVTLTLAYFFVFGAGVRYAAAPVLALGIVTGTLLGLGCEYFIRRSRWYARAANTGLSDNRNINDLDEAAARYDNPEDSQGNNIDEKKLPGAAAGNRSENFRKAREAFFLKTFTSGELAMAGLCMAPALLLNPDTHSRIAQFLFFFFLVWLSGKKNNLLVMVSVMFGIVFFNLLVPYGEILFSVGPLNITSGALMGGIRRAVTLEGLFMLSRCCVRQDLALPGTFGELAGESLRIFSVAAERKQFFKYRGPKPDAINLAERLDGLMISLETEESDRLATGSARQGSASQNSARPGKTARLGPRLILAAGIILAWIPFIIRG